MKFRWRKLNARVRGITRSFFYPGFSQLPVQSRRGGKARLAQSLTYMMDSKLKIMIQNNSSSFKLPSQVLHHGNTFSKINALGSLASFFRDPTHHGSGLKRENENHTERNQFHVKCCKKKQGQRVQKEEGRAGRITQAISGAQSSLRPTGRGERSEKTRGLSGTLVAASQGQ